MLGISASVDPLIREGRLPLWKQRRRPADVEARPAMMRRQMADVPRAW